MDDDLDQQCSQGRTGKVFSFHCYSLSQAVVLYARLLSIIDILARPY